MNEKSQTMSWSLHKLETFFRIIHLPINPAWFAVCVCLAVKSCMAAIALVMPAIFLAIDSCHYFGNNNLVMFVSEELHFVIKLQVRKVRLKTQDDVREQNGLNQLFDFLMQLFDDDIFHYFGIFCYKSGQIQASGHSLLYRPCASVCMSMDVWMEKCPTPS